MRSTVCILGLIAIGAAVAPVSRARAEHVVYIGTYTEKTASKGIYAFRFNDSTGTLTPIGLVAETPGPSFLTASANGKFVYAVNELQNFEGAPGGSVTAFAVDAGTSKLTSSTSSRHAGRPRAILRSTGPDGFSRSRTTAAATIRCSRSVPMAGCSQRPAWWRDTHSKRIPRKPSVTWSGSMPTTSIWSPPTRD